MKPVLLPVVLALALPAVAHGETFTFKSVPKQIGAVQLAPEVQGGRPSGAAVYSITTEAISADGKKTTTTGQCANWILPPGSQFGSSAVCKYSDGSGDLYTAQFTCETPGPTSDCWGKLIGKGGQYKGRTGAFTFHNVQGSTGTGFWTD